MSRARLALRLAVIALAVTLLLERGFAGKLCREWLAAASSSAKPEIIAVVETSVPASAMDAALVLRASLRYSPARFAFLDPITDLDGLPLLISKLGDAKQPVTFSASKGLPPLPPPAIVVPAESSAPGAINPLAAQFIQRIDFDRLMIRAERSERGEISVDLDNLFRGRLIAVETTGENGALLLAARRNGLMESPAPPWLIYVGVLLAASLPWWRGSRAHHAFVALVVACLWLLMALAIYQEAHLAVPLVPALLLPLLALIPRGSNKAEQRKLPA